MQQSGPGALEGDCLQYPGQEWGQPKGLTDSDMGCLAGWWCLGTWECDASSITTRSSVPTRALGLLVSHRIPRGLALGAISAARKTLGSIEGFRLNSSSAGQDDNIKRLRKLVKRNISNLDPGRLVKADIIDLSGPRQPRIKLGDTIGQGCSLLYYTTKASASPLLGYAGAHKTTHHPFPPGRGFLYLHRRPGLPAVTGEIRFRVVDADSPSDSAAELFAKGRDLLDHTGHKPWAYICYKFIPPNPAQDRDADKQVSVTTLKALQFRKASTILNTISDSFVLRLPIHTNRVTFIHDECVVPSLDAGTDLFWRDTNGPGPVEGSNMPWRVYEGPAVLRYELKKVDSETIKDFYKVEEGQVVLVLRVVQLLDPLGPDGVPFSLPEGGALAQSKAVGRYWRMHLDRALKIGLLTPSSLKILEELYLSNCALTKSVATGSSP
ncbi:hypothetical protein DFP72DRAFT_1139688 [Ephemerocybe angulata]|uniref:Uncharacterized protein n=1 Tax=Ephemerocybe angulata TaxID=980116 RepID=A0A8H6HNR4_9AGAR|nr:hypothetical protein DFP72DRAFT_1139688 [Tulosesus angulatus]